MGRIKSKDTDHKAVEVALSRGLLNLPYHKVNSIKISLPKRF